MILRSLLLLQIQMNRFATARLDIDVTLVKLVKILQNYRSVKKSTAMLVMAVPDRS
ncbi:hypothetical protein [Paenibacillus polymyxa]|uniref:hypothetical protein n=1 Tax=Paenibacillus polymyxa TaxID=1406 RepID=UPI0020252599|nr:hypothetical protein [Paenibacillus polymyxa]WDZ54853.1 hypothetical protein MF622_09940 [Paenibacillus polymyxa]